MTAGDILFSPHFWILFGLCVAAGWYAKRSLIDGIFFGGFAPLILGAVWFTSAFALLIPYRILLALSPGVIDSAIEFYQSLPAEAAFLLNPATILTGFLFILYCHIERAGNGLPSGYRPRGPRVTDHNSFSYPLR